MAKLELVHIGKIYKSDKGQDVPAVTDFNLASEKKEFIVFVGPSGCGKSTTLRMIAGLEDITSGDLFLDEERMNDIESSDRNVAMVFQNYALYPHMTAYENMAFGLKNRHVDKATIDSRIRNAAKILDIENLLERKPKAMSGGQRQRVALGRAIVRRPKLFLLDEPLSNLDAKLRAQLRVEITKLYDSLDTTFIYVTHDQTEAMTMGTRIVVMRLGTIQQTDVPTRLYDFPANRFVAGFIGTPQMNFFEAVFSQTETGFALSLPGGQQYSSGPTSSRKVSPTLLDGKPHSVIAGVRPEAIVIHKTPKEDGIKAKIVVTEALGSETLLYCDVEGATTPLEIVVKLHERVAFDRGQIVWLSIQNDQIHLFDDDTEVSLLSDDKGVFLSAPPVLHLPKEATQPPKKTHRFWPFGGKKRA